MIYTELTVKAMNIAYNAHHGQTDVSGAPYIFHPYHVAEQMDDEATTCVALLHDVVEDTSVTIDDLDREFPKDIVEAVRLLTHDKGIDYEQYIKAVCDNPIAKAVKYEDLRHNMDETRVYDKNMVSKERLEHWREKYGRALEIMI